MNNRIRRQTYPDAPQEGAKTAKSGATNNTVHPLTAPRGRALAVQRLNSFGKSRKGVPMSESNTPRGWKISQVERLIDLPRRDIQRACYAGQGGACILEPTDSTWGKRFYSSGDIAKLMLVKLHKDQGYSLPEIRDLLNHPGKQFETQEQLSIWRARLEEEMLEVELKLNRVIALLAALEHDGDKRTDAIEDLLRQQLPQKAIDALTEVLSKAESTSLTAETLDTLESHLDIPGIDLVIDLWAGPGTFDQLINALWG